MKNSKSHRTGSGDNLISCLTDVGGSNRGGKEAVTKRSPHISEWRDWERVVLYLNLHIFLLGVYTDNSTSKRKLPPHIFEYPCFINHPKTKQVLSSNKLFLAGAKSAAVYCCCFTIFGNLIAFHCNKTVFQEMIDSKTVFLE